MNPEEIERHLQSIGKAKFIIYYEAFRDLPLRDVQDLLERSEGLTRNGTAIRYSNAQALFRSNADLKEALRMVANAQIAQHLRQEARRILMELE